MTDQISDMLIRIKNAQAVKKESVDIPYSKLKMEIAKILQVSGFTGDLSKKGKKNNKIINVSLLYDKKSQGRIHGLRRVSKLSKRVYRPAAMLRPIKRGTGLAVISTSKGLMADQEARRKKIGGEVFFEIW
ncbi:MAG: 30S ribosomal protein S8 [Patescibacteria group bacterium]